MTQDVNRLREFARIRAVQLNGEQQRESETLAHVRIWGVPLFVLSLVCPIATGATSLWNILPPQYSVWAIPVVSFVGAATVALHRGLQCETHQAAVRRSGQTRLSIIEDYESVTALPDGEVATGFKSAEARLRELRAMATNLPPVDHVLSPQMLPEPV